MRVLLDLFLAQGHGFMVLHECANRSPEQRLGENPLEGARAGLDMQEFEAAYGEWKDATQQFEEAVRNMHAGTAGAHEKAQELARRLAALHHRFMESSQPYFKASNSENTSRPEPRTPRTFLP
jgi:uncharacterized protein YukE